MSRRASSKFCAREGLKPFGVGAKGDAIALLGAEPNALATRLRLRHAGADYGVELPLAGAFQTANALVAAGLAIESGGGARARLRGPRKTAGRARAAGARRHALRRADFRRLRP